MATPNRDPLYSRVANTSSDGTSTSSSAMAPTLTTAAADYTGASTNNKVCWTADATNGGFIAKLRLKATGSNVATVLRVYINNGGVNTSAANNSFFGEISLPLVTASATQGTIEVDYQMNIAIDPGFRIYVGLGTTVAAGWVVIGIGGKY